MQHQPAVESWRKIPGFPERFEVNAQGAVRTLDHTYFRAGPTGAPIAVRRVGRVLKPTHSGEGYRTVNLGSAGVCKNVLVHRLVALAFLGPEPEGHEVNHKNGVRHDNCVKNLEWVTRSQNVAHSHLFLNRKRPRHATAVVGIDPDGARIEFDTMLAAQNIGGFNVVRVCQCVRQVGGWHKGYRWYRKDAV